VSSYQIKLGFVPTRREVFSAEDAVKYRKIIEAKLAEWQIDYVGLDWLNEEALLYSPRDVAAVTRHFRSEAVDALFCPHCNFGTEEAVAKLGKALDVPVLLWGPRDEAPQPDGMRLRDTQCGLFATAKGLQRLGVPFTYIVNCRVDDPIFARGFSNFMAAAAVVKTFRNLRIGQVGPRPREFWSVIVNEAELLERFGVQVVPRDLASIVEATRQKVAAPDEALNEAVSAIKQRATVQIADEGLLPTVAAFRLVLQQWAQDEGLGALAVQCWPGLQETLGIAPCSGFGELIDAGIQAACETDVHGAISLAMLQAAAGDQTKPFFADWTIRHPENDNAELLWHCGPFPYSLKAEGATAKLSDHYIMDGTNPAVMEFPIRGGDVTIARMDSDGSDYWLLTGEGRATTGPHTRGTYLWMEVSDWPRWEEKIIRGPYVHHVAAIHGRLAPVLYEACRYIPGLNPDPVEPTEAEIQAWLRGAE